jgi:hypothetical protein
MVSGQHQPIMTDRLLALLGAILWWPLIWGLDLFNWLRPPPHDPEDDL